METKLTDFAKPECRHCKGRHVVRYGHRHNKKGRVQVYWCRRCRRIFTEKTTFPRMKHKGKVITATLDLYFKNVSLRKIQEHLEQFHNLKVSHVTILNWVRKYSGIIKKYTDTLQISEEDVCKILHADEMMVKANGKWVWFWDVMDSDSRFILSTIVSRTREMRDGKRLFRKTRKRVKHKPEKIITDGLNIYPRAINKVFYTRFIKERTDHVKPICFMDKINNNPIERLQGSVRERTKLTRGFGNMPSARMILEGWEVYYNFIRPHMSLNGRTPAEAAGIGIDFGNGNRWMELIKRSVDANERRPEEEHNLPAGAKG